VAVDRLTRSHEMGAGARLTPADVTRFFHLAFRQAREIGVRLRLRTDFGRLREINQSNRDSWAELFPIFDPTKNDLGLGSAVWIEGLNERGETICTHAARAFRFPAPRTLLDEARSLRVFYKDPAPRLVAGDRADVPESPGAAMSGETACIGALWVKPAHRSSGLIKITARLCKAYATIHWRAGVCWSFCNPAHFVSGVARAFGPVEVDEGVMLRLGNLTLPAVLTYQRRDSVLAEMASVLRRGEIESSRRMETTLMNMSLARCQGIASR
jgi:hypothetical protein